MVYPQTISIDNIKYYNVNDLKVHDPLFFNGCSRSTKNIIKTKNIDKNNYVYGNYNKKFGWRLSTNQNDPPNKSQLLLKDEWVIKNLASMTPDKNNDNNKIKIISVDNNKKNKNEIANDNNIKQCDIPKVPDLLILNDNEKFKDDDGNIVEVETRGKKTVNEICFLASDVAKIFEFDSLVDTMTKKTSNYLEGEHYKIYLCEFNNNTGKNVKKEIFITYEGILKIFFSSQNEKAKTFKKWATETLFTVQIGTKEQKIVLAAGLFGVPIDMVKQFLSTCASKIPCIYEIVLGVCKNLRVSMNIPIEIPDDYIIIKYGFTDDLERRMSEHYKDFNKIKGVKLELVNYSYVDPKYLSQAEVDIKNFFADIETKIKYESYDELIAIKPTHIKQINNQYKYISMMYSGDVNNTIKQMEDIKRELNNEKLKNEHLINIHKLENEKKDEQHKNAIKDEQHKNAIKDEQHKNAIKNEQHKSALLIKEVEIMKMNYELEKLRTQKNVSTLKN